MTVALNQPYCSGAALDLYTARSLQPSCPAHRHMPRSPRYWSGGAPHNSQLLFDPRVFAYNGGTLNCNGPARGAIWEYLAAADWAFLQRFSIVCPPDVDRIIEDLYAGTLDVGAWDRALTSIADLIESSGAFLFSVNPATTVILRDEIHRLDPEAVRVYRSNWIRQDIRLHAAFQAPVGEPIFERKLDLKERWESTAIYNDFLVPQDTPYLLATWLHKAPEKLVVLSFQGSRRHGSFNDSDARQLKPLLPHVRRSLEIRDRLEAQKIHASTLSTAIEGLQFGLFVLDSKGRILETSGLSEDLLRREPAIRRDKDHTLWLRDPAGSLLRDLVRTGKPSKKNLGGIFSVPRGNGLRYLSVVVAPMPAAPVTWTGADPRWLVFICDPEKRLVPTAEIISRDLGISAREAEIAALLAVGHDISNVSRRLGITVHTARSHLKHIFGKTGVRSQSDLIRRVLTGPAGYIASRG